MTKCKKCGAGIRWLKTVSGASMPVNIGPRDATTRDGPPVTIVTMDGRVVRGWEPHWATCPFGDEFRKQKQRPLFGEASLGSRALARSTDPKTSHDAAASVNTTRQEFKVLLALYHGNLTPEEATFWLEERGLADSKVGIDSISPRFAPLRRKGLIEETGEKRKGRSKRGRMVWRITPLGRTVYETEKEKK